ncbi:GMC family oxidoreductase N-terminal domain-containing protein [Nocardia tengchongensis]
MADSGAGVRNGLRYSSSRAYLADRPNPGLQVLTRVHVVRVVIEKNRATGLEIAEADGSRRMICAAMEVIVSAGVIGRAVAHDRREVRGTRPRVELIAATP